MPCPGFSRCSFKARSRDIVYPLPCTRPVAPKRGTLQENDEIFSRSTTAWIYHQYGAGQSFFLASLDIEIEVRQFYRRLSIPAAVKEVEEEDKLESELNNE